MQSSNLKYEKELQAAKKKFEDVMNAKDWTFLRTEQQVDIYSKEMKDTCNMIKGVGYINAPLELIMDTLNTDDLKERQKWDPSVIEMNIIEQFVYR
jgi:hypothetical protein